MSDLIPSLIRTYVPLGVAFALAWVARTWGIVVDEDSSAAAVTLAMGVLFAVYFGLVRALESRFPWIGGLLGLAKAPTYDAVVKQEASGGFTAGPASTAPTGAPVSGRDTVGELTTLDGR